MLKIKEMSIMINKETSLAKWLEKLFLNYNMQLSVRCCYIWCFNVPLMNLEDATGFEPIRWD